MTLQCKFLMNRQKRYTQSVHCDQRNSSVVILRVSSNSVNSGLILFITIHGRHIFQS